MRVLAASGDAPAALASYRDYCVRLREEMNVEPDEETAGLYQRLEEGGYFVGCGCVVFNGHALSVSPA